MGRIGWEWAELGECSDCAWKWAGNRWACPNKKLSVSGKGLGRDGFIGYYKFSGNFVASRFLAPDPP